MPDNRAMLASPEYYDSLASYVPTPEFLSVARGVLPGDWRIVRGDTWFSCVCPRQAMPPQGWKIHVSAAREQAAEILRKTAAVLVAHDVSFKFALDPTILKQLNGKNWSRSGSGKFVTIYPNDEEQFRVLVEELRTALDGHVGPYVLSDRRYRDSKVVHYRYGGFVRMVTVMPDGEQRASITAPDGSVYHDERNPFFSLPPWVSDPFPPDEQDEQPAGELTLRDGRYAVQRVLHFSNTGGVYVATDRDTGEQVVVKEARPHSGGDGGEGDSFALLTKEFHVLQALAPLGLAARPVELFAEWEHLFLVEEFVEGVSLLQLGASENRLVLSPHLDAEGAREFRERLRALWSALATALHAVHDAGVVLGDLSPRNVLVDPETLAVKFIDFEATVRAGVDASIRLATPGFASPSHLARGATEPADDYYALGALMLASLFPLNGMFQLDASAAERVLADLAGAVALPDAWADTIAALLSADPAARPAPDLVVAALRDDRPPAPRETPEQPPLADLVRDVARHVESTAEYRRTDRLFPGDSQVFATNPLNVAHGAAGVAYALGRMTGQVPGRAVAWILAHDIAPGALPTGLYTGTSGVAWALAELDAVEPALRLMEDAATDPARFSSASLGSGAAGYGLACVRFWELTRDERHLAEAVAAGDHLLATAARDGDTLSWPDAGGGAPIGYLRGASGAALFLLYLHLATGDDRWLDAGRGALAFDLGHGVEHEGLLTFPQRSDRPGTYFPYWENGSAGIGKALVRYYAVTGDEAYRKTLDPVAADCSRRYAAMPALFRGLAGLGDLLLDCHQLLGEEHFLDESRRVAEGVRLFAMRRPSGVAFPGELLYRVSTDFATGSSGIGLFLHRLATNGPSFGFTLDSLLPAVR